MWVQTPTRAPSRINKLIQAGGEYIIQIYVNQTFNICSMGAKIKQVDKRFSPSPDKY